MSPVSCPWTHWLARPSPPGCSSWAEGMLYHRCPLLCNLQWSIHGSTVSEANAKMKIFGINTCPGFHHDQNLLVRCTLIFHCQVDSLEDVSLIRSFQGFDLPWIPSDWLLSLVRFFTFWGFLHGVWILPKVFLGPCSVAKKTLGKPRPGHICAIGHLHMGLSLHYSAIIRESEDDCTKNCPSL